MSSLLFSGCKKFLSSFVSDCGKWMRCRDLSTSEVKMAAKTSLERNSVDFESN